MNSEFEKLMLILNFINQACIEGGCGYDLKEILRKIIFGIIENEEEAVKEWTSKGWKIFE